MVYLANETPEFSESILRGSARRLLVNDEVPLELRESFVKILVCVLLTGDDLS